MIPLVRRMWRAFWYDELFAVRWARGFLLWLATILGLLLQPGADPVKWTLREWGLRLLVAALAGSAVAITAGQKNPPPESRLP